MAEPRNDEPFEKGLKPVLAEYMLLVDRGEMPDRNEFLEKYPWLADELQLHFEMSDCLKRVSGPTREHLVGRFPKLEIQGRVGRGGMGAVYKAWDKKLDRPVAVKILPPQLADDSAFVERFKRGAEALAQLDHPNIVKIYGSGEIEGLYYIVMEFVDGETLRQRLEKAEFSMPHLVHIVPQICDGLEHAHNQGIIHRDIKPENILITKQDLVKIVDFGLAKIVDAGGLNPSVTASRTVVGTLLYVAPEQIKDPKVVDRRSDLYALGVVLDEIRQAKPDANFMGMDSLIHRATQRDPNKRFQQASQLKSRLHRILLIRRLMKLLPYAAIGLLFLVLAVTASFLALPSANTASSKHVLIVIAHRNFWHKDYAPVRELLEQAGCKVTVASSAPGPATPAKASGGKPVTPDLLITAARPGDYDAVVFAGGAGFREYVGDSPAALAAKNLAVKMLRQNSVVCAVCDGVPILADFGTLAGRRVTGQENNRHLITAGGAEFVNEPVVISEQVVITARSAADCGAFVETLRRSLPAKGGRVLFVIAHRDFWYKDFGPFRELLEQSGCKITVASSSRGEALPASGSGGKPVMPDLLIKEAVARDYDAVLFAGGGTTEFMGNTPAAQAAKKFIFDMRRANKPIAAVCSAPTILANAGMLKGVPAVALKSRRKILEQQGAVFVDQPVVVSQKTVITVRSGADARELVNALKTVFGR